MSDATSTARSAVRPETVADVAESLLADRGFEGLSVRHVAEEVGASRQVVYTHFDGMDGLLDELHRRFTARLGDAVSAAEGERGTDAHLVIAGRVYRSMARRHAGPYQLVFERPVPDYVPGAEALAAGRTSFGVIVAVAASWLRAAGRLDDDRLDPSAVRTWPAEAVRLARALWSLNHGVVVLERVGLGDTAEGEELADDAVRALLAGW
ncbi:MAG: TetR/AcrR family transcriptional regulator [Actinomycetota bacterium]